MPEIEELLELDLLTLREHTEQAGDVFDPEAQRLAIEHALAASEVASARRNGLLVAYAMLQPQESGRWFVTSINTHPNHRSAPIFRQLFRQLLAIVEQYGITSLQSHVYKTNQPSIAFHKRMGFQVTRENDKAIEFTVSVADQAIHWKPLRERLGR